MFHLVDVNCYQLLLTCNREDIRPPAFLTGFQIQSHLRKRSLNAKRDGFKSRKVFLAVIGVKVGEILSIRVLHKLVDVDLRYTVLETHLGLCAWNSLSSFIS